MNIIIVNDSVQTLMWCEYVNADIECCSEFVFCTESHLLAVKSSLAVQCKITLVGCNKGLEELRACCQLFEVVPRLKSVNLWDIGIVDCPSLDASYSSCCIHLRCCWRHLSFVENTMFSYCVRWVLGTVKQYVLHCCILAKLIANMMSLLVMKEAQG
jgi:hypothetical protein